MEAYVTGYMVQLNKDAAECCLEVGVNSVTDISGFGLMGHALEMAKSSNCTFEIDFDSIPLLDYARETTEQGFIPGGTRANRLYAEPDVDFTDRNDIDIFILSDPQTSGGLLISVEESNASQLMTNLLDRGLEAAEIGQVSVAASKSMIVR